MKAYKVGGYIRISKKNAERRYENGEIIYLCPFKLRPGEPWHPECAITKESYSDGDVQYFMSYSKIFEDVVREYTFYNCNYCAGKYPAYYIREVGK